MINLLAAFFNVLIGYLLIVQYGNERAISGEKKYWDWLLMFACLNIMAAGLNVGRLVQ